MGLNESKMVASAAIKPEPAIKKTHVSHLIDPRSPSAGIDRTPIQVGGLASRTSAEVNGKNPLTFTDPRSPTVGITRTPVREVMRATVGSFARHLGRIFHSEVEGKAPEAHQKCFNDASTEPLLTAQLSCNLGSLAERVDPLDTPVLPPLQGMEDLSPFVLLEEPQVKVEVETEADITLEEAEEAKESPLHKRLSMSLITCHEGAPSSQIFVEVHRESISSPVLGTEVEQLRDGVDHPYALPPISTEAGVCAEHSPTTDVGDSPAEASPAQQKEEKLPSSEETKELVKESTLSPISSASNPAAVPGPEQPQTYTSIRCPTFDSRSPSQAVFKPQWLGKGFGPSGLRARGVQGHSGKRGSSPLAVRVAVKNATNENKGQSGKLKQKGTEGRSPLQILSKTNSPRDQRSQMKLKVSTPERQRLGQMDRRVLAVSLDKENR